MDPIEVPAGVVIDACQNVKDLVLLARLMEDRSCNGKRADRYRSDTMVFRVRHDPADLMRMVELNWPGLIIIVLRGLEWVDLCEQTHGGVVE